MPRKASTTSPKEAVAILERQRAARRSATAAYRQRQAESGAKVVQVFVPDDKRAVAVLRHVAAALRAGDGAALARAADELRDYRASGQQISAGGEPALAALEAL